MTQRTPSNRRTFLKLAGVSAAAAGTAFTAPASAQTATTPEMQALQAYLRANASSTFSLPLNRLASPSITWAGLLTGYAAMATTLPNGVAIPISSPLIGGPIRNRFTASLAGNPTINGLPCLAVVRPFTCKGQTKGIGSPNIMRFKTDAPVFELTGVIPDGSQCSQTLIIDGQLVPSKVLVSGRGAGGWNFGTIRVALGSRAVRDIWIETALATAYLKIDASDVLLPVNDTAEPQITVVGDSYLGVRTAAFANTGGIALELGTRLGIRRIAIDAIGGTGFWNSSTDQGNLNDRLPAHAADNSNIYLVMAGLNDYGDNTRNGLIWPSRETYEQSVLGYLRNLRAARPNALIVLTSPFCPIPSMSDATYVAHSATNSSGEGDFPYRLHLYQNAIRQIAGPWVFIDVTLGGGWMNSSGATGDVTNLQWFTGGTAAPGTSASWRPGNTLGGGGGGYGGIASVPVISGGRYRQAPEIIASYGSGSGLLLASTINAAGTLTGVVVVTAGQGYTSGDGLPLLRIDPTYQITPATLGTPVLQTGTAADGQYPLTSFAPPGVPASNLNNVYSMLGPDTVHPSALGVNYLSGRLARNIFDAVMAL